MKRFLLNITLFFLIFIGLTSILWYSGNSIISSKGNFIFDKNIRYLLIGHSHPQCAVNDSLIPGLKNIANSGEGYFYNYIKLKKVLSQNQQINTVFIEFTNNHIDTLMDTWTWGETYTARYSFLFPFLSAEDHKLLIKNNPKGYVTTIPDVLKSNLLHITGNDFDFTDEIGGYRRITENRVDSLLKGVDKKSKLSIEKEYPTSKVSLKYLKKIITLCVENDKNVFLIRSPQHPELPIKFNENHFKKIRKDSFTEVPFLDFTDFPVKSTQFADLEHLNYKGAFSFSLSIKRLLENGLLDATNKEGFADSLTKRENLLPENP